MSTRSASGPRPSSWWTRPPPTPSRGRCSPPTAGRCVKPTRHCGSRQAITTSMTSPPVPWWASSRSAAPGPAGRMTRPAPCSTCCAGCRPGPSRRPSCRPRSIGIRSWRRTSPAPMAVLALPRTAAADFLALGKPRIVAFIVITVVAGFLLVPVPGPGALVLVHAVIGTTLVAAGTNALNQLFERDVDALMHRTERRPLAAGRLSALAGAAVVGPVLDHVSVAAAALPRVVLDPPGGLPAGGAPHALRDRRRRYRDLPAGLALCAGTGPGQSGAHGARSFRNHVFRGGAPHVGLAGRGEPEGGAGPLTQERGQVVRGL